MDTPPTDSGPAFPPYVAPSGSTTAGPQAFDLTDGSWTLYDPDGIVTDGVDTGFDVVTIDGNGVHSIPVQGDAGSAMGTSTSTAAMFYRQALDQSGNGITWSDTKRVKQIVCLRLSNNTALNNDGCGFGVGVILEGQGTSTPKWGGAGTKWTNATSPRSNAYVGGDDIIIAANGQVIDVLDIHQIIGWDKDLTAGQVRTAVTNASSVQDDSGKMGIFLTTNRNNGSTSTASSSGTLYEVVWVETHVNSTDQTIQFIGNREFVVDDAVSS